MKGLVKFAVFAGALALAAKVATAKKAEWQGLTETQVRDKLESKLPAKVPQDKRAEIADKVVHNMRDRGMLGEDAQPSGETDAERAE